MARDADIERRLLNWARWRNEREGLGGGNYAKADMAKERVDGDGWDWSQDPPTFEAEAIVTDMGVMRLASELRATVEAAYLSDGSVKRVAKRLHIAECTVYARIDMAHRKLRAWLAERSEQARAQAARDAAIREACRP